MGGQAHEVSCPPFIIFMNKIGEEKCLICKEWITNSNMDYDNVYRLRDIDEVFHRTCYNKMRTWVKKEYSLSESSKNIIKEKIFNILYDKVIKAV